MNPDNFCSNQPNLTRKTALGLGLPDIHELCLTSENCTRTICQSQNFWRMKYLSDNEGDETEPENGNWQEHYRKSQQQFVLFTSLGSESITRAVTRISFGYNHGGFLTISGNLYLFGSNRYGELGLPRETSTLKTWQWSQSHVQWFLCEAQYTTYINSAADCYITGSIGQVRYGFEFLASDVRQVRLSRFPMNHPMVMYISTDHELYLQWDDPEFVRTHDSNIVLVAKNVKEVCASEWPSISYIKWDLNLYTATPRGSVSKQQGKNILKFAQFGPTGLILTTNSKLHLVSLDQTGTIKSLLLLIANDVVDFEAIHIGDNLHLSYLTSSGKVYLAGSALFMYQMFNEDLFVWLVNHIEDDDWLELRRIVAGDVENFNNATVNTFKKLEFKQFLLNLTSNQKSYLQTLMPWRILGRASTEALKYPVLIQTNTLNLAFGLRHIGFIKSEYTSGTDRKFI